MHKILKFRDHLYKTSVEEDGVKVPIVEHQYRATLKQKSGDANRTSVYCARGEILDTDKVYLAEIGEEFFASEDGNFKLFGLGSVHELPTVVNFVCGEKGWNAHMSVGDVNIVFVPLKDELEKIESISGRKNGLNFHWEIRPRAILHESDGFVLVGANLISELVSKRALKRRERKTEGASSH